MPDSSFIIIREDLQIDAITIVGESILIGRLPTCELTLNHPSVSRLQAGISNAQGDYYIHNLRPSNAITLNGQTVEQYQALAAGDVLGIGPFALNIDFLGDALVLKVSLQIAATPGDAVVRKEGEQFWNLPTTVHLSLPGAPKPDEAAAAAGAHKKPPAPRKPKPGAERAKALDVFWDKRITAATKTVKPSPLFPLQGRPSGKAQSMWAPTTDLKKHSRYWVMFWGALIVAGIAGASAFLYASAFAPAPISEDHTRVTMQLAPPIAAHANAGSCTSCHRLRHSIDTACASCHTTDAFTATVIPAHMNAEITCVACHPEHRGAQFRAIDRALLSCVECHNDNNKNTYNGQTVSTPHGGTLGYPIVNGHWKWRGLDRDEFMQRQATLKLERLPSDTEDKWRSKQFHAVHLYRVKAAAGMPANNSGELSCSSCHTSFDPLDTTTPRATCAKCHNGSNDPRAGHQVIAADKPNCTSCHVQHTRDKRHWNPSLLSSS
jgi:hypothetical protein